MLLTYRTHQVWKPTDSDASREPAEDNQTANEVLRLRRRTDVQAVLECLGRRNKDQRLVEHREPFILDISRANLTGAVLMYGDLSNVSSFDTNLSHALFGGTDLSYSRLWLIDLTNADLEDATLANAKMRGVKLRNANLSGTNLSGTQFGPKSSDEDYKPSKGLTQAQLDQAVADRDNPPILTGINDSDTGLPLVWRGGVPRNR